MLLRAFLLIGTATLGASAFAQDGPGATQNSSHSNAASLSDSFVPPRWKNGPPVAWVKQQIVQRYTLGKKPNHNITVVFNQIDWIAPARGLQRDMGAEKFMQHTNAPIPKDVNGISYPLSTNYTVTEENTNSITGQVYPPSVHTYDRNYFCYVKKNNQWVVVMGPTGKPWPPK